MELNEKLIIEIKKIYLSLRRKFRMVLGFVLIR